MNANDIPSDLISVADAAALVPSPRRGKTTSTQTIYRWVKAGMIRGWKRRRPGMSGYYWTFVSRAEVLATMEPAEEIQPAIPPPHYETCHERKRRLKATKEALARHGLTL